MIWHILVLKKHFWNLEVEVFCWSFIFAKKKNPVPKKDETSSRIPRLPRPEPQIDVPQEAGILKYT